MKRVEYPKKKVLRRFEAVQGRKASGPEMEYFEYLWDNGRHDELAERLHWDTHSLIESNKEQPEL